jgi:NTP pyrophosphatase (non-canonical NTP hydrolase)
MLFSDYAEFVAKFDLSRNKPRDKGLDITTYGLAAEIGSLLSAIKKSILAEEEDQTLIMTRKEREVTEEIGDVLWYTVALGQHHNRDDKFNVLIQDISNLRIEVSAGNTRAAVIEKEITPEVKSKFLRQSEDFILRNDITLEEYQKLAYLTARTEGPMLERVCLAVLTQLGAEVLRKTLPQIELDLNKKLVDRDLNIMLGEIVWHLAALSTLSQLNLGEIGEENRKKIVQRYGGGKPTPLPDRKYLPHEQFPRRFDVSFVTVRKGHLRMYRDGRPLGDELTDNSIEEDGYRFHDVMHLTFLAKLGWSPVMRKLMGRKRKSDPKVDEVQDGARAQIVDELIVKYIHSEFSSLFDKAPSNTARPKVGFISFRLLAQISRLARGLEAEKNQLWEWEEAILDGTKLFQTLKRHGQGTVSVDLNERTISFREAVYVDIPGAIVGIGTASKIEKLPTKVKVRRKSTDVQWDKQLIKEAVLKALNLDDQEKQLYSLFDVYPHQTGQLEVRAKKQVQDAVWKMQVISFRMTSSSNFGTNACTVFAMSDPRDMLVR